MNGIYTGKDFWPETVRVTNVKYGHDLVGNMMVPNKENLQILSEAFDALDAGQSYRKVLEWFNGTAAEKGFKTLSIAAIREIYLKMRKVYTPSPSQVSLPPTKEELIVKKRNRKLAAERRRITAAMKRIAKMDSTSTEAKTLEPEEPRIIEVNHEVQVPETIKEQIERGRSVTFEANPGPQTAFLEAPELVVLYGGAAGGGKSYGLLADPIRWFTNPNFAGILFRRTNDELRELKQKSKLLYPQVLRDLGYSDASTKLYSEKDSEWRFPAGGRLWFTYLDHEDDVQRYQGQSFSWIGFDELTQWSTPKVFNYMVSRLRSTDPILSQNLAVRATTNPGGPGHGWVKRMFIDPAPPNTPFWATDDEGKTITIRVGDPNVPPEQWGKPVHKRLFIPAKLSDNKYLAQDGQYYRNLLSLGNPRLQAQLLDGDWSIADGAAFPEFSKSKHTIEPFDIPRSWRKFRSMDWGYQSAHAIHWCAIDPFDNALIVYREFYGGGYTAKEVADIVKGLERDEKVDYGVLDSSVWHQRSEGPSPAEIMIANGCRWRPSDRSQGSRVAGKNMLHQLLRMNEDSGRPGILFFNDCRRIIADLEVAPADPDGGDDIDERYRQQNHAYDSIRYLVLSRPKARGMFEFDNIDPYYRPPVDRVFGY